MISVWVPGRADGLYQFFSNTTSATTASVDVFVLRGTVNLELWKYNGNLLLGSVSSTTTDQWETLKLNITNGIPTEFVLYTGNGGPASFYADNASVPSAPEPSSLVLLLLGALPRHRLSCTGLGSRGLRGSSS